MSREEYEDFLNQQHQFLQRDIALDESPEALMSGSRGASRNSQEDALAEEEGMTAAEQENQEEAEMYNKVIQDMRASLLAQSGGPS